MAGPLFLRFSRSAQRDSGRVGSPGGRTFHSAPSATGSPAAFLTIRASCAPPLTSARDADAILIISIDFRRRTLAEQMLRGLIHSDGYRYQDTGRAGWVWPRYGFTQVSTDIQHIFCSACERIGVHWTKSGERTIYVSRKADVATLDTFIGPKR